MAKSVRLFWIGLTLILSVLFILLGFVYLKFEVRKTNVTKGQELEAIARLKSDQIADWIADEIFDAKTIAHNHILISQLEMWLDKPTGGNKRNLIAFLETLKSQHGYENIFIVSEKGDFLISSAEDDSFITPYLKEKIARSFQMKSVVATDLYRSPVHDTIHIDFITPIRGQDQAVMGAVVFQFNPNNFLFPLIQSWPTLSKSSETLLYKVEGDSILFLNELKHKKNTALNFSLPLTDEDVIAIKAVNASPAGLIEGNDYAGNKVLGYVLKIPDTEWIMVSKTDKKELFSALYYEMGIVILLVVFLLLFLAAGMAFLYNSRQKSIYRDLYKQQEYYFTTLKSIGDAVISTNKNGKVEYLNPVAEQLTGWLNKEIDGQNLDEVFKIINEETREVVESPVHKVLREGIIVGLANHTLLISKDGRETPIADSGAPIKNEKGEITGVVLVFRDQTEEREHQNKLIQSEAKYREREFWLSESQKAGRIGSYDFDILNNHWTSSDTLNEIFGITNDNPRTLESWNAIIHPDHQEEMLDYFLNSVVKKRKPFDKDYKISRVKDGAERWVLGRGELTFDETGNPVRMFGTIMDITERKLFEQELQESEERFRKAVLLAPIPIMVHDEDGNVINLSEGWNHFSGYSIEEIPTLKAWTENAFGEKAEEVENYVAGMFDENKTIFSGEFEIIVKSGEKRIWNFYTTPLGKLSSGKRIMLSMAPDVTQRVQVKTELEESERAYRHLFENHTAIKLLIDPENGQVVKANQAAAEFYGWSIEKLHSMNIGEINTLPSEKIKEAMNYAETNRRVYFEFKHRLANGQVRDVEVHASRTEYAGKQLLHSIVHDITEKKQLFDELLTAKEKAEESERLKSAFLANMSHEIRTPLNGILGFTSLLTEEDNLSQESKKEYAFIINKSAEGLLKIINDILDISRLETGKASIEQKPFDLGITLSTIDSIFQKKLGDTGNNNVELIVKKPDTPLVLNADENRLIQIFSNLLDNALRFTSKGSVTFGVSKLNKNNVEFFVADTGVGILKEKHEIIFDRFSQADSTMTRSYGGTGLGLAIVKKLLELMGGTIVVESEPGEGACFRFHLPCTSLNENEDKISDPEKEDSLKAEKSKILVVEDDSTSRHYFRQILGNRYAKLLFAESGKEALHLFETQDPDIILMDIGLPDMSGLEIVRKIRETNIKVFIIAQTAYAMPGDHQEALEAGCDDYIAKPIRKALLLKKLRQFNN